MGECSAEILSPCFEQTTKLAAPVYRAKPNIFSGHSCFIVKLLCGGMLVKAENLQGLNFVFLQTRSLPRISNRIRKIYCQVSQRDPQELPVSAAQSFIFVSKPVLNLRFEVD